LLSRSENGNVVGLQELQKLAASASTLPVNRIWFGFFSPTLVYQAGSKTLNATGLDLSNTGDYGFAALQNATKQLVAGGVEVYLSMGGWNYNCYPYLYARYSVGGYGTSTPNYWKIDQYGNGNLNNCVASNQFCYVCEPPSEGTSLNDFVIFPEVNGSTTWQQAASYVASKGSVTWNYNMIPGRPWTDTKTGITTTVPGSDAYLTGNRDPYADFVTLAKEIGATGIDLDYEEMWHADYFKTGPSGGPWTNSQTVYKYAAITQDLIINIKNIAPTLKLSTAAGAAGAWSGNWWGGNLKGIWLQVKQLYPDIMSFMSTGANAGGINVMTYDLSDNEQYYECPDPSCCSLDCQVNFYMGTYTQAGIPANVGYEVGTPAYPDPTHDPSHQLPLSKAMLQTITTTIQPKYPGGFFWELFKAADGQASPTEVAQAICKVLLPGNSRCSGTIPPV